MLCYVVSHAFRKIEPLLFIICAWEFPVTSFLNIYMVISFHIAVESNNRNQHIVITVALSYCRLYVYVQEKQNTRIEHIYGKRKMIGKPIWLQ